MTMNAMLNQLVVVLQSLTAIQLVAKMCMVCAAYAPLKLIMDNWARFSQNEEQMQQLQVHLPGMRNDWCLLSIYAHTIHTTEHRFMIYTSCWHFQPTAVSVIESSFAL